MDQKMMIDRAQRGDMHSFAYVIQQIQDESYRIANSYLLNEAASMDAVCDAVEEAVIHIQKLDNSERFNIWFNRIVIHKCKSHLLNSKSIVFIDDEEVKGLVKRQTTEENLELQAFMKQQSPMTRLYQSRCEATAHDESFDGLKRQSNPLSVFLVGDLLQRMWFSLFKISFQLRHRLAPEAVAEGAELSSCRVALSISDLI